MPYFLRVRRDGSVEAVETKSPRLDVPSHMGSIWLDGDVICLQFPSIVDIKVEGQPPLQIVDHMIRFPANETGITAAEAILHLRKEMMREGNEAMLLAFAKHGTDRSELLRLYREVLH